MISQTVVDVVSKIAPHLRAGLRSPIKRSGCIGNKKIYNYGFESVHLLSQEEYTGWEKYFDVNFAHAYGGAVVASNSGTGRKSTFLLDKPVAFYPISFDRGNGFAYYMQIYFYLSFENNQPKKATLAQDIFVKAANGWLFHRPAGVVYQRLSVLRSNIYFNTQKRADQGNKFELRSVDPQDGIEVYVDLNQEASCSDHTSYIFDLYKDQMHHLFWQVDQFLKPNAEEYGRTPLFK